MLLLVLACAGGAVGAGARFLLGQWFASRGWIDFPWATMLANVTGALLMGLITGWLITRASESPELRVFLATGVLGGYTTFSAFSLDAWLLAERGQMVMALIYVAGSVALSIAAFGSGFLTAKALHP